MNWRREELAWLSDAIHWLPKSDAQATFELALKSISKSRYGLNDDLFQNIDRLNAENNGARQWLIDRIGDTDDLILLAFDINDVCSIPISVFVDRWQDIFSPSRDDVIVIPTKMKWRLFYCHEDEFEFAQQPD